MAITILHLSDIQYGRHHVDKEGYRAPLYHDEDYLPQLEKLEADLDILKEQEGLCPDFIVVTGDIAEWSLRKEYEHAKQFLGGLTDHLNIDKRYVVMVPGNHDINRKLCESARLSAEAEETPFHPPYFQKFRFYAEFFNGFYKDVRFPEGIRPYQFSERELFVNFYFPDKGVIFIGFNSCIDESELDPHYGNITVDQAKKAITQLKDLDPQKRMLRIALMHHNFIPSSDFDNEHLRDADEIKPLLLETGFHLMLHGHQHIPKDEITGKGEKLIHILATGSAGLDSDTLPENSRRCQIINIDEDRVKVYRRCFDQSLTHTTGKGCWKPDMAPDQKKLFEEFALLNLMPTQKKNHMREEKQTRKLPALEVPKGYWDWVLRICKYMDIDRLREKGQGVRVELPELFVPLYAQDPRKRMEAGNEKGMMLRDKEYIANIEELIHKAPYLIIEGQAGSGKTTLLRHFCYRIAKEATFDNPHCVLPVLMFLKDLRGCVKDMNERVHSALVAEEVLGNYFNQTQNCLDLDCVKGFCNTDRAILLFDGLDEIGREMRDLIVNSFADFRSKNGACKMIFSGRPNGIEGAVIDQFGDNHIKILPLTMKQVDDFIHKWFCYIEDAETDECTKTADDMINEMKAHPAIDELKDTPLMLTAICLLYHDGKELPGQRAELYKKFIEHLLYKRFVDPEKVLRFLKTLALSTHSKKTRNIDRIDAVNILGTIYTQKKEEEEEYEDYRERLEKEFDRIEPGCGLIKFESGHYSFWHHTFQEFLTAACLIDKERGVFFDTIWNYWDDDWFAEVIELYIGYLSIQNMGMANEIIKKVLSIQDKHPFKIWHLAARAFNNIHKDRREPDVTELTRNSLLSLIDSSMAPPDRLDAGEILGKIGDLRDLRGFVHIKEGVYPLSRGKVEIESFDMCKYPVTNRWFREFIKDGGYINSDFWSEDGRKWRQYTKAKAPRFWHEQKWNCPNAPVVGVCWYEADAFSRWLTETRGDGYRYRLPDENEWEAASSGFEKREYPWGNGWEDDHCNSSESKIGKTSPVGIFIKGDTPEGIADLAGNVWEWTCSDYHSNKILGDFVFDEEIQKLFDYRKYDLFFAKLNEKDRQLPVLRGGPWGGTGYIARCAFRFRDFPVDRDSGVGFRCVRTNN